MQQEAGKDSGGGRVRILRSVHAGQAGAGHQAAARDAGALRHHMAPSTGAPGEASILLVETRILVLVCTLTSAVSTCVLMKPI